MKPGTKVRFDGHEYEVVRSGPRDEIEPLPGVKRTGNALIVLDSAGKKHLLYEWEVEVIDDSTT